MPQCWLRPNRRALLFGMIVPGLLLVAGLWLASSISVDSQWPALRWVGYGISTFAGVLAVLLQIAWWKPRVGYEDGYLLAYLQSGAPFRIPIDIVECFFLGQTKTGMRAPDGKEAETSTVVVRLAESAKDWHHRDIKHALGHWCDGYITINGTWCEPLSSDVLKQLNDKLIEIHRSRRSDKKMETA